MVSAEINTRYTPSKDAASNPAPGTTKYNPIKMTSAAPVRGAASRAKSRMAGRIRPRSRAVLESSSSNASRAMCRSACQRQKYKPTARTGGYQNEESRQQNDLEYVAREKVASALRRPRPLDSEQKNSSRREQQSGDQPERRLKGPDQGCRGARIEQPSGAL